MVFIRYEVGSKVYCYFDLVNGTIHISGDIIFEENYKWDWTKKGENFTNYTFLPNLLPSHGMEEHFDIEAKDMKVSTPQEETLASQSELKESQPHKYKSIAEIYLEMTSIPPDH